MNLIVVIMLVGFALAIKALGNAFVHWFGLSPGIAYPIAVGVAIAAWWAFARFANRHERHPRGSIRDTDSESS